MRSRFTIVQTRSLLTIKLGLMKYPPAKANDMDCAEKYKKKASDTFEARENMENVTC